MDHRKYIERYFDGKLSTEEKAQMDNLLHDPAFQTEFRKQRMLWEVVVEYENQKFIESAQKDQIDLSLTSGKLPWEEEELATELNKVLPQKDTATSGKIRRFGSRKIWLMVASWLLVACVGVAIWANIARNPRTIALEAYDRYREIPEGVMGTKTDNLNTLRVAVNILHNNGSTVARGVIRTLKEIPETDKVAFAVAQVYIGHAHFILEEFDQAFEKFDQAMPLVAELTKSEKQPIENEIVKVDINQLRWNKVLAAAAAGKFELVEADRDLLLQQSAYQQRVQELSKKLKWRYLLFD